MNEGRPPVNCLRSLSELRFCQFLSRHLEVTL